MDKKISTEFVIDKIEHCKQERNKLMVARNVSIMFIATAVFLADLGGHLDKNGLSIIIIFLSYFYGGLSLSCISLQIAYRVSKYTKYMEILGRYDERTYFNEEAANKLKHELLTLSENKLYVIMIINSLLYTAPITVFLGLIYYMIHILN